MRKIAFICILLVLLQYASCKCDKMYRTHIIKAIGNERLSDLQKKSEWWVELADKLLTIQVKGRAAMITSVCPDTSLVLIVKHRLCGNEEHKGLEGEYHLLLRDFGYSIIQAKDRENFEILKMSIYASKSYQLVPHTGELILVRDDDNMPVVKRGGDSKWVSDLVGDINEDQVFSDLSNLASFNRYTLGTNITKAKDWIIAQVRAMGVSADAITEQSFPVSSVLAYNVIVKIEGATKKDNWVIFGAHYDSTSQSPSTAAPGAEDNASGSAGILNILRAFVKYPPQQGTIFFMWYSGEEQGLYGSKFNAQSIVNAGNKDKVKAVYTHDMIGYYTTKYGVLLETYSTYQNTLLSDYATAKSLYVPTLSLAYDFNPFGSDHVSYLERGMPALLAIDQNWANYPNYHRTTDVPSAIKKDILRDITKIEIATAAMKIDSF